MWKASGEWWWKKSWKLKSEIQDDREDRAGVAQGRRKEIRRKSEISGRTWR